jgi:hypothetical protein
MFLATLASPAACLRDASRAFFNPAFPKGQNAKPIAGYRALTSRIGAKPHLDSTQWKSVNGSNRNFAAVGFNGSSADFAAVRLKRDCGSIDNSLFRMVLIPLIEKGMRNEPMGFRSDQENRSG